MKNKKKIQNVNNYILEHIYFRTYLLLKLMIILIQKNKKILFIKIKKIIFIIIIIY